MKFSAKTTDVTKVEADVLAVFASVSKKSDAKGWDRVVLSGEATLVDKALGGELGALAQAEAFEAEVGKTFLIYTHGKLKASRVVLVGLGTLDALAMNDLQTVAATIGRRAKAVSAKHVAVAISSELFDIFSPQGIAQGLVEGITLGTYTFLKHKSHEAQKKDIRIEDVQLLVTPAKLNAVTAGIERGEVVAGAVVFARDLVNEPPSYTTPTHLGSVAKNLAKGKSAIDCTVLGKLEMEKLGMGGILGIARGSDEEPKFIKLHYKGGGRKTICLVGKGITFDTGGLSLKPADGMETMKLDMAGAAAILGVFSVISQLKLQVNVVGLISATENMPGPKAVKPGDVVTAMSGKTIEILNTDAEGRVVLADALSYAVEKIQPDAIVDLATLTGACMVALGEDITGLFANNEDLGKSLEAAALKSGEKVWQLPLAKEYKEFLKSTVADIKNISGKRYGGAISGALFLQEFVPDALPWAHLDIAGPSFAEKDAPLTPRGGTGFGVRMLLAYLQNLS